MREPELVVRVVLGRQGVRGLAGRADAGQDVRFATGVLDERRRVEPAVIRVDDVLRIDLRVELDPRAELAAAHVSRRVIVAQAAEHGDVLGRRPLVLEVGAELRTALRGVVVEDLRRDRVARRIGVVRDRFDAREILHGFVDPDLDRVLAERMEVVDAQALEIGVPILLEAVDAALEIVRDVAEVAHAIVAIPRRDLRVRRAVGGVVRVDGVEELIVLELHVVGRRRRGERIVRIERVVDRDRERGVVVRRIERERIELAEARDGAQELVRLIRIIVHGHERRRVDSAVRSLLVRVEEEPRVAEDRRRFGERRLEIAVRTGAERQGARLRCLEIRAMRQDVDDRALSRAAELGGEGAREDLERVDRARIDDLAEVRRGGERQRHAVDLVGEAVEAVRDGLVVREGHDARKRFDDAVETLVDGKRRELLASDRVDRHGRRTRAFHVRRRAVDRDDLRDVRAGGAVRRERVAPEGDASEHEGAVGRRRRTQRRALAREGERDARLRFPGILDDAAHESGRVGEHVRRHGEKRRGDTRRE